MHSCPLCSRTYERADHLSRHVNSHQNARTFRCPECSKGFNRRDILQRHQAAHAKNTLEGKPRHRRRVDRVSRACEACAVSKAKCDEQRPCKRCRIQDETCVDRPSSLFYLNSPALPSPQSTCECSTPGQRSTTAPSEQRRQSECSALLPDDHHPPLPAVLSGSAIPDADAAQQPPIHDAAGQFPNLFDHIIAPEAHSIDNLPSANLSYDVLDFMMDKDFLLDDIDTLDFDFDAGLPSFLEDPVVVEARNQADQDDHPDSLQDPEGSSSNFEAFKRSPWFWKPSSAQNTFSDHTRIPLDEDSVDVAASPHWPYSVHLLIQDKLSQQTRDRILQLVVQTVGARVSIPSFPSAEFLDVLVKNGIAKKIETDAWIHPHTFCSQTTRTELLTALIAAGCVCFGIMSVGRTGGMLQEIVRVALNNLVESDNSVIRDLQYLQAYMIWLDIGIFCGYKRKMEIAESNFQPLCTALRKAGAFNKQFYKRIIPSLSDDDATLERKWRQWVEQESYKRLVYHLFEHDLQVSFAMTRNPITSYAEFSVPFPAEREIWLAPSPSAWRATHLSKPRAPEPVHNSLRDMLTAPDRLSLLSADADATLATSILVHGIGALVWDHRKLASITAASSDPTAHLWLQTRRQALHALLAALPTGPRPPAVLTLLVSFLQLALHAPPLDDLHRFAAGDRAPLSASWLPPTRPARTAVWHAAQLLRHARAVPPYQLRGFDSICVYHATLALWAYGMLDTAAAGAAGNGVVVQLDGAAGEREAAEWVAHGVGVPSLCLGGETVGLRPGLVMRVGAGVLEGNYPNSGAEELPPMIMSLRGLMRDLGRGR